MIILIFTGETPKHSGIKSAWNQYYQIFYGIYKLTFTHLKFWIAAAMQNFKWEKGACARTHAIGSKLPVVLVCTRGVFTNGGGPESINI